MYVGMHRCFKIFFSVTGPIVTRQCLSNGIWGGVDLTNCTARSQEPFLIVYFNLSREDVGSGEFPISPETTYSEELLLSEVYCINNCIINCVCYCKRYTV